MNYPQQEAACKPERLVMQHPITSISGQRLGDDCVVAEVSVYPEMVKPPIEPQTPPRWIGHDHLEALGISERCIREWLAT